MKLDATPETVRPALACIPPDDRELWLRVGMALQSEFPGEEGFALFDAWSQGSDRYDARAVRDTWRSFKPGKVTLGTLWHEAKARGYRPPKPSAPRASREAPRPAVPDIEHAAADEARQRGHEAAARRAVELWAKASKAPAAPYLAFKGIKSMGARTLADGALLVPMRAGPTYLAPVVKAMLIKVHGCRG